MLRKGSKTELEQKEYRWRKLECNVGYRYERIEGAPDQNWERERNSRIPRGLFRNKPVSR